MVSVVLILARISVILSQPPWHRKATAVKVQATAPRVTASEEPVGHIMREKKNIILKKCSFTY